MPASETSHGAERMVIFEFFFFAPCNDFFKFPVDFCLSNIFFIYAFFYISITPNKICVLLIS